MENQIDISKAKCTGLSFSGAVNFASAAKGGDITGFELEGYTGAVVDRWWGKLVVSLSGISSKQQMPVFRNHNQNDIVGYSTEVTNDSAFLVKGVFSKNTDVAKEVMALAEEGFPWQASIGVSPKVVVELKRDASMVVNGSAISGPAEVWLESEVRETSFVPLGADSDTSATVFSNVKEIEETKRAIVPTKKEEPKMDLKTLKEKHPDLVALIVNESAPQEAAVKAAREEGAKAELKRMENVYAQMYPGQEEIVTAAMFDGKSQAGDVAMLINAANIKAQVQAGVDNSADAPDPVDEQLSDQLPSGEDKNLPVEDRAKKAWDKTPSIRAEFGEFETYLACVKGEEAGLMRTLKDKE